MYENFKSNKELLQKCPSAKHVCCSSAHFPPSEAKFPKVQTSICKAFRNAAIVTGLVSYILALFSLDILCMHILFLSGSVKGCQQKSEFCILNYCLCCTKVRYETYLFSALYQWALGYIWPISPMHNVLFVQYVFLPTEQAETYLKILSMYMCLDIPFNIYLSQLVRLEGKHDFWENRDFQPLNF